MVSNPFKTNPVYRGRKPKEETIKYTESTGLKLTPFIGDGNTSGKSHIVMPPFYLFKTNPVYRGRKLATS